MRALLDTHTFIWAATDDRRLSRKARATLEDTSNEVYLSAVSALEIGIKGSQGRLNLPMLPRLFLSDAMRQFYLRELPVTIAHGMKLGELPLLHRDPFDRLLVAQAQAEDLPILTSDPEIARYDVEVVW